jgi:hypothetical protein
MNHSHSCNIAGKCGEYLLTTSSTPVSNNVVNRGSIDPPISCIVAAVGHLMFQFNGVRIFRRMRLACVPKNEKEVNQPGHGKGDSTGIWFSSGIGNCTKLNTLVLGQKEQCGVSASV